MNTELFRYVGPLPDIARIYPPDLDLTSDPDWLRANPRALARIRTFRDETRRKKRVILLTVRVLDQTVPDGWRPAWIEAHPGHWGSDAFLVWQDLIRCQQIANAFALHVLKADAEADAGHALTVLHGLVLPDADELTSFCRPAFAPFDARTTA